MVITMARPPAIALSNSSLGIRNLGVMVNFRQTLSKDIKSRSC
jgi:hypothetical protein